MPTTNCQYQDLSFLCLNVHGGLKEKIKINDFVHSMREHDVVLLSKTWSSVYSDVDLDGYKRMSKVKVYLKEGLFEVVWDNEHGICMQFEYSQGAEPKDLELGGYLCLHNRVEFCVHKNVYLNNKNITLIPLNIKTLALHVLLPSFLIVSRWRTKRI